MTYEGECQAGIVVFCDQEMLLSIDCAGLNDGASTCGFDEEGGYYNCIATEGQ